MYPATAIAVTPAAANPYDQQVRGSGRSFFATLFGPSTARMVVSYSGSRKPGTIVISTAQRVIQDAGTSTAASKTGVKATDFARAFVNRYLGLKDAAAINGDSSVNGSSDVRLQLMSAAGGSTSLLA